MIWGRGQGLSQARRLCHLPLPLPKPHPNSHKWDNWFGDLQVVQLPGEANPIANQPSYI